MRRLRNILLGVALLLVVYAFHWRDSMTRVRKWMYWWLVAALLIIVGNLLQGCHYVPEVSVDLGPFIGGRTVCDQHNNPIVVYHSNMADIPRYRRYTILHERVHVAQARRLKGGCQELTERYTTDSLFRLAVEGEAYCAVWREENLDNTRTHIDWLWLVNSMSKYGEEKDIPCTEYPP